MNEDEKKLKVATFRFGLISEFVTGVRLGYGEKEKLINEKLARSYDIPFSERGKLSRSTLEKLICDYKKRPIELKVFTLKTGVIKEWFVLLLAH